MNKRGEEESDILASPVIYLVLVALFVTVVLFFLWSKSDGASFWEDYYAKEIAKTINLAKQGDSFFIDVHRATKTAKKNGVAYSDIFTIDNSANKVCARLSQGHKTCYNYYNNVNIVNFDKWSYGLPVNKFGFDVVKK